MQGLINILKKNIDYLLKHLNGHPVMKGRTTLTVSSICEIVMHQLTKALRKASSGDLSKIREDLNELMMTLVHNFKNSKSELSRFAQKILKNGDVLLNI